MDIEVGVWTVLLQHDVEHRDYLDTSWDTHDTNHTRVDVFHSRDAWPVLVIFDDGVGPVVATESEDGWRVTHEAEDIAFPAWSDSAEDTIKLVVGIIAATRTTNGYAIEDDQTRRYGLVTIVADTLTRT